MTDDEDVQLLEAEGGVGGLGKKERKTIERTILNNRGRKWLRNQLGVLSVITGVSLLGGLSVEYWLGFTALSLPVTVYHATKEYEPIPEENLDE